mmetsp:Transcript_24799/g.52597  ORF Transcript_24799/g.52597 Transcript_24799/m.52597 type:complete len:874 (+) Transcript_24799:115-2736(+)
MSTTTSDDESSSSSSSSWSSSTSSASSCSSSSSSSSSLSPSPSPYKRNSRNNSGSDNSKDNTPSTLANVKVENGEEGTGKLVSDRRSNESGVPIPREGSERSGLLRGKRPAPPSKTNNCSNGNGDHTNKGVVKDKQTRRSKRQRLIQKPGRYKDDDSDGDDTAEGNINEKDDDDDDDGIGGNRSFKKTKRKHSKDENKKTGFYEDDGGSSLPKKSIFASVATSTSTSAAESSLSLKSPPVKRERFRGTKEERTCPHCNHYFSSASGARYHINRKVCQRAPAISVRDLKRRPFSALKPGQQFVTAFGLVEVIKDDRAIPTAILPKDVQRQYRKYTKSECHKATKAVGRYVRRSSQLRVRRNAINAVYEKGNANRRSIFEAYFDGDPEHMRSVISANKALASGSATILSSDAIGGDGNADGARTSATSINPKEPDDSFPDRIVECKWISDERSHVVGPRQGCIKRNSTNQQQPKKLYLRRRLLMEAYDKNHSVYCCPDCGRKFTSSYSLKLHVEQNRCGQEVSTKTKKRKTIASRIEREICDIIRFPKQRQFIKKIDFDAIFDEHGKKRRWKKKKKRESGVYPEILIGMGFKLVSKRKINIPEIFKEPNKPPQASLLRGGNHGPDHVLERLKGAFKIQKRKADDQKYGSIYAEVYKGLGFKFPGKRKSTNVGNHIGQTKRRKRKVKPQPKPKPLPTPKPLPPAIDVGALVDEIKSGRYPSIKVFKGEHEDYCILCEKGGSLFCCEFCKKVEHFACIRKKYTLKAPEPDEDFMCHRCIGVILSRRARAEKRRLLKQGNNEKKKKEEEKTKIVKSPTDGKEYPYMAAQAQEVNELVEVLKDSQIRLRRSIETTKMNNIRRQVISGVYPDGYSPPYWN